MGRAVYKQPDGRLAVWSTIVDDFILIDATEEEYVAWREQEALEDVRKQIREDLAMIAERGSTSRTGSTLADRVALRNEKYGADPDDPEYTDWCQRHVESG